MIDMEAGGLKIVGIIPARAGSKGLPDKNIHLLLGKPLIYYTIMPGAIETPMLRSGLSRPSFQLRDSSSRPPQETFAEQHPLKRIVRPDEVAQAVLFLADSLRSSFIRCQSLIVDGGACARLST